MQLSRHSSLAGLAEYQLEHRRLEHQLHPLIVLHRRRDE
jgi:hypothetical protein